MIRTILFISLLVSLVSIATSQTIHKITVNFDFASPAITSEAANKLDNLLTWLKVQKKPIEKIEMAGHCDSIGNVPFNETLSDQRAEAVKNYLLSKDVAPDLLKKITGYGKRLPLNDNADSLKRYQNRRVEIAVYVSAQQAVLTTGKSDAPTIDLSKVKADSTLVLENINFYPDSHYPLSGSYPSLVALLHTLQQNGNLKIQIRGFVCCLPLTDEYDAMDMDTYTHDLSTQRAKYIYEYLTQHGIAPERLSYHGYGGKHPLVKEITDEDRTINRRVEIKILSR